MKPHALRSSSHTVTACMLMLVVGGCGGGGGGGGGAPHSDAGSDSSLHDATTSDSGAGGSGAGPGEGGMNDAGDPDAGDPDAGDPDAGDPDAGDPDAGDPDAGDPDAGNPDAGNPDGGGGTTAWHHVFDMTGESSLTDAVELPSGDIVAVGKVSSFGAGNEDGLVARFSADGAYVWSRAIGTSQVDGLGAVVADGAGGVIVVGQSKYSSSVAFVARIDQAGNLVFSQHLNAPSAGLFWNTNLVLTDVVRMSDGNFALIGHHEDDDTTVAGPGRFRGWVGIMTPTGSLAKQRRFGAYPEYLGFYAGAVLPGGDLVVAGWWDETGLVMRLDSMLGVKWRSNRSSDFADYGVDLLTVLPLPSGDLIVGGRYFEADFSTTVSHWFLQRLSATGAGVWARRLEHDFSGVTQLLTRGPNEFIALGYAPNGNDADAYAAIVDVNGFVVSQHSLGLPGTDRLTKGALASNGALILAGYDGGSPHGSARIAKIPNSLPACDPNAGDRLASVSYPPAPPPNTSDFGEDYGVTASSTGPTLANGPASLSATAVCGP